MRIIDRVRRLATLMTVFPIADVMKYRAARTSRDAGAVASIGVRALKGKVVHYRPGTTDLVVLWDTFVQQYHLPPFRISPDGVIVDLGANVGYTAAHFAAKYPRARIIGVELDNENWKIARQNTNAFGDRVSIVQAGVWIHDGTLTYSGDEEWGFTVTAGSRSAPAITMPTLLRQFGISQVDYLKMDIEGAEAEVLFKDAEWLTSVQSINLEVHHPATLARCAAQLKSFGLRPLPHPKHPSALIGQR